MSTPEESAPVEPRKIGFLERRWNMVTAFAKKAYEHLFSPKTWISAAVIFGGMALASHPAAGPTLNAIGGFFHVEPTATSVMMAMGKALAVGTALNAGIAMYKEAKRCDDCDHLADVVAHQREHARAPELVRAPEIAPEQPIVEVPNVPKMVGVNKAPNLPGGLV